MLYRPYPNVHDDADGGSRNVAKWIVGFLLLLALLALFSVVQIFQATTEDTAKPALRRAIAAISEIDPLIERHGEDLRQRAADAPQGETFRLNEFPVDVDLTAEEASTLTPEQLREVLLSRAADTMYEEGTSALRNDERSGGSVGVFSLAGTIDRSLGLLRDDVNRAMAVLTIVFAIICAALAALLTALCRGFGRMVALGIVVLLASVLLLLGGLLLRLSADVSSGDEFTEAELLSIAHEFTWLPIRNGLAFAAVGAVMLVAGLLGARLLDREPDQADEAPEYAGSASSRF